MQMGMADVGAIIIVIINTIIQILLLPINIEAMSLDLCSEKPLTVEILLHCPSQK